MYNYDIVALKIIFEIIVFSFEITMVHLKNIDHQILYSYIRR